MGMQQRRRSLKCADVGGGVGGVVRVRPSPAAVPSVVCAILLDAEGTPPPPPRSVPSSTKNGEGMTDDGGGTDVREKRTAKCL